MYSKRLPQQSDIVRLSTLVREYPVDRSALVRVARLWNFKQEVVSLLRQFPSEAVFTSQSDLVKRAEDLSLKIRAEWEAPNQVLLKF